MVTVLAALAVVALAPPALGTFIVSTSPADGEVNVAVSAPIVVVFSGPPDVTAFAPSNVTISPDLGGGLALTWSGPSNTILTILHADFLRCTVYRVGIRGFDPGPVPNPWNFTTECPTIVRTDPFDQETGRTPINIVVSFAAPVDHIRYPVAVNITPYPGPFSTAWSIPAVTLTTSLLNPLLDCSRYRVVVTDVYGPLQGLVPNPWSFSTACPGPFIAWTEPVSGATNVPQDAVVNVTFSEAMDPAAVDWAIAPSVPVTPAWPDASTLTLTPDAPLARCTRYTVTIDATGLYRGAIPNPWSFDTACPPPSPPSAPRNLTATPGNSRVVLAWLPPADDGGSPLKEYRVYRGTLRGAETFRTAVGLNLTYIDLSVVNAGTYYYQVAAVNAVGVGPRALEASATPRNLPPSCTILSPAAGASTSGIAVIAGTASDDDGALVRVEVRVDSGLWWIATGNTSWTLHWNTTSVPNGEHTITARAYDGTAYSEVARVIVTVANPVPGVPVSIPVATWVVLLIAAIVTATALGLALVWRRRGRRDGEEGPRRERDGS